jgi:hypothetical protein
MKENIRKTLKESRDAYYTYALLMKGKVPIYSLR